MCYLLAKYKKLRNKVTQNIRKDNYDHNNNIIEKATSEGELWKITNEVIKPKSDNTIRLVVNGITIEEESLVAETFNNYFIDKIKYKSYLILKILPMLMKTGSC